jgi:hypothetical protein
MKSSYQHAFNIKPTRLRCIWYRKGYNYWAPLLTRHCEPLKEAWQSRGRQNKKESCIATVALPPRDNAYDNAYDKDCEVNRNTLLTKNQQPNEKFLSICVQY